MPPTEVTFGLSPFYDHPLCSRGASFLPKDAQEHDEFEVETDEAWEEPMPFWSETVRGVVVE